jgi:hypothetical protein
MFGRVSTTLILATIILAARGILGYIGFQCWLRNSSECFKLPGWLERLRYDLGFDWRIMVLSGALTSLSWVSVSLLLLVWKLLFWNLAPLLVEASLVAGLFSALNCAFRLQLRR